MQKLRFFTSAVSFTLVALLCLFSVGLLSAFLRGSAIKVPREDGSEVLLPEDDPHSEELPASSVRRSGVLNFLVCGVDRASGLCDVIILAQLDRENGAMSLVQIPRDTYAAYTEGSYRKLNGAPHALGGIEAFVDFLEAAFRVPIDHYLQLDLDCVGDVVDAIGGVTLDVPVDMDYEDASQNLSIHLKAGVQTLDGDTAEQYLRYRSGYVTADLGRLDAQKRFVSALLTEIRGHTTLPDLIHLVRTLYGRVTTDLTVGEAIRLVSVARKLSPDRLVMETLPGEATRTGVDSGAWYYVLYRDAALDAVNRLLRVTDAPIDSFDPDGCFTSSSYPHFEAIYRKKSLPR